MINLAPLHSFSLSYQASNCQSFDSIESLHEAAQTKKIFNQPHLILGGGTNTIFSCDYQGSIIRLTSSKLSVKEDGQYYYLQVDAGYEWHELVKWTLANGMYGLENLALIPGTVGAAPIQNIGAYGIEFSDVCDYVEYLDKQSLEVVRLSCDELQLGYRDSIFKQQLANKTVISKVGLKLSKKWKPVTSYQGLAELTGAQQIFDAVVALRQSKLPDHLLLPNSGSFFKNPIIDKQTAQRLSIKHPKLPLYRADDNHCKVSAAWLIEQCGLKGHSVGDIEVYKNHALILTNKNHGSGEQLIELIGLIRSSVQNQFGILLEPEVKIIGQAGELNKAPF